MNKIILVSSSALLATSPALAQEPERTIDPQMETPESPGESYLAKKFKLSKTEARKRMKLQAEAETLATDLAVKYPDIFLGVDIQHEPVYQVTASFSSDAKANEVRAMVPAGLRSVFKTRVSKFNPASSQAMTDELTKLLSGRDASIYFSYGKDRFVVQVAEEAVNEVKALIPPSMRSDVTVQKGNPSRKLQTNATTAEWIYGGWNHYRVENGNQLHCTFAFSARDSSGQPVMVTAGHCPGTRYNAQQNSGKTLTFASPTSANYDKNGYDSTRGRSYDFKLIPIPDVSTAPEVYFFNNVTGSYNYYDYDNTKSPPWVFKTRNWANVQSGLPASGGRIHITNTLVNTATSGTSNPSHPKGAARCKSGNTTGVTCGIIVASSVNENNTEGQTFYGLVKVGDATEEVIAWGGDSGGAVFSQPVWNSTNSRYEATAAGVVTSATWKPVHPMFNTPTNQYGIRPCHTYYDGGCEMNYMPIDRINDFMPAVILIRSGASGATGKTP